MLLSYQDISSVLDRVKESSQFDSLKKSKMLVNTLTKEKKTITQTRMLLLS
jgi:hypothetical protein